MSLGGERMNAGSGTGFTSLDAEGGNWKCVCGEAVPIFSVFDAPGPDKRFQRRADLPTAGVERLFFCQAHTAAKSSGIDP